MKFLQTEKPPSEPGGSGGEGAASILRGARQRSTQALDATLSRLVNAASPLLDRKGYKVVLVREPLVPRLAQQLRHLTMLLDRFSKWHGIPRCELGAVVRAGEAFDHLDQIRMLCCVGDRTQLFRRPDRLIEQTVGEPARSAGI